MKKLRFWVVLHVGQRGRLGKTPRVSYRSRRSLKLGAQLPMVKTWPAVIRAYGWEGDRFVVHAAV